MFPSFPRKRTFNPWSPRTLLTVMAMENQCLWFLTLYRVKAAKRDLAHSFKLFHFQRHTYVLYNFFLTHWKLACPSWSYRVPNFLITYTFLLHTWTLRLLPGNFRSLFATLTPYIGGDWYPYLVVRTGTPT